MRFSAQIIHKRRAIPVVAALLLAGVAVRLYASWCLRHNLNLDAGVVALMAKHIAEGTAFPVFFYGQAHMGSLEALFSGLFCRLFGISGFAVCLGTAFVAAWLLPMVYLWARDAAGRAAGGAALAFIVIGPGGFFHYSASPRGGYAAALTLGAFLIWYATRMAIRWAEERRQRGLDFFLLGVGAGLAWWSSQLATAAILTAALLLILVIRQSVFTWRLFAGAGGFFLGSAPFWIYNMLRGWPSFAFAGTFGRVRLQDGLYWFFTDRFTSLMLPAAAPHWLRLAVQGLYIALALFSLALLIRSARIQQVRPFLTLLGILLFTILFSVLYAGSHFAAIATPRYFLPMVAPIAILIGIAFARISARAHPAVAILPLLLLIAVQTPAFSWAKTFEQREQAAMRRILALGDVLEQKELHVLYAPNIRRSWNFALRERHIFVDLENNFHALHSRRAEETERIAVLDNFGGLMPFLETTGGTCAVTRAAGHHVFYDLQPTNMGRRVIPLSEWKSAVDAEGQCVMASLTDNRVSTFWERPPPQRDDPLMVTFKQPLSVNGFRIVPKHPNGFPASWSVEGKTVDGEWILLHAQRPVNRYFWSGPRVFWGGPAYRLEARFSPRDLHGLRITAHPARDDFQWSILAMQLFGPATDNAHHNETEALDVLVRYVRDHGIDRVYADRWEATRIHTATGGRILTPLDPGIYADVPRLDFEHMRLTHTTALLVRSPDADHLREMLDACSVSWNETVIGPWTLFTGLITDGPADVGLHWLGWTAMLDDARQAALLVRHARQRVADRRVDAKTLTLIEAALELNPHLYEAHVLRADSLRDAGHSDAADEAEHVLRQINDPTVPISVRFPRRLEFLGYSWDAAAVRAGDTFRMTYHWAYPPEIDPRALAVFVHFRRDRILFQDDHVLMSDLPHSFLVNQEGLPRIAMEREIRVPDNLAPGPVEVVVGVIERRTGQRLRPQTDLPTRRNAVALPVSLMVTE